jgi:hypothetical protein
MTRLGSAAVRDEFIPDCGELARLHAAEFIKVPRQPETLQPETGCGPAGPGHP